MATRHVRIIVGNGALRSAKFHAGRLGTDSMVLTGADILCQASGFVVIIADSSSCEDPFFAPFFSSYKFDDPEKSGHGRLYTEFTCFITDRSNHSRAGQRVQQASTSTIWIGTFDTYQLHASRGVFPALSACCAASTAVCAGWCPPTLPGTTQSASTSLARR